MRPGPDHLAKPRQRRYCEDYEDYEDFEDFAEVVDFCFGSLDWHWVGMVNSSIVEACRLVSRQV